jgi:hypothetical protein
MPKNILKCIVRSILTWVRWLAGAQGCCDWVLVPQFLIYYSIAISKIPFKITRCNKFVKWQYRQIEHTGTARNWNGHCRRTSKNKL